MSRFFKSRFFIVSLLICAVLVIVPTVLSLMGQGDFVRDAVGTVAMPFRIAFTGIAEGFDGFVSYFREFDAIKAENRILRDKLKENEEALRGAEAVKEENEWLYNYLGLRREHIDYDFEAARVTGRESGSYMTVFTLNRGSMHGVDINMTVVTDDGIVGYVSEVGANWCKVLTVIETAVSVGAYVERSGELGLVEGVYTPGKTGFCQMSYLPASADIKVGDLVLSSGIGSIYPRGLSIGVVTELVPDGASRSLIAMIEPSADLTDLRNVMIIKGFDITEEEAVKDSE